MVSSLTPHPDARARRGRRLGAALALAVLAAGAAQAEEVALASQTGDEPALALEGTPMLERAAASREAPAAPRFTVEQSRWPAAGNANIVAVDAAGRPLTDVTGVTYRWWLRRGRADVGIGLGALGQARSPAESGTAAQPTLSYAGSTLTLGLRYRLNERSTVYADASGARPVAQGVAGGDLYSTKVGVEFAGARSRLGFDKGALGMQLDSGYRMSLRVKHGGFGIYVRGKF